jgi:hypothetical protein
MGDQADDQGAEAEEGELGGIAFTVLARAQQKSELPKALAGTSNLPLGDLDPEVLERLAGVRPARRLRPPARLEGARAGHRDHLRVRRVPAGGYGGCRVVEFRSSPGMGTFVRRDP